jgi:hypothetical protein
MAWSILLLATFNQKVDAKVRRFVTREDRRLSNIRQSGKAGGKRRMNGGVDFKLQSSQRAQSETSGPEL